MLKMWNAKKFEDKLEKVNFELELGQYPLFRLGLKELSMMLEFSVRKIYVIKNYFAKIISILTLTFFLLLYRIHCVG